MQKTRDFSVGLPHNNPQLIDQSERAHWFGYYMNSDKSWYYQNIQWSKDFFFPLCDIVINHDIIRIFNEVRISRSSSPCDIVINHDIRIFNEVRISSSPCDVVINHDIIRIFNEVRISRSSSPCDIVINHDIIRIFNEVRISSSPCDIVINHDIIRIFNEEFISPPPPLGYSAKSWSYQNI